MYLEVTHSLVLLRPVWLEAQKPPTRRMVYRGIFPSFQLVQLIADHHTGQENTLSGKMDGALRKRKK
jgi:hypothetical protein